MSTISNLTITKLFLPIVRDRIAIDQPKNDAKAKLSLNKIIAPFNNKSVLKFTSLW